MYTNKLICEILKYINNNINKDITIHELANLFYYNKTYIMKRFKKEIGISIHNYINKMRIHQSLLDFKTDDFILKIAIKHGFNSLEYFSETFKKIIGVNPTTYKKYIINRNNINEVEEEIILNSITELYSLKNQINFYLKNQKPDKLPVKSFFKL